MNEKDFNEIFSKNLRYYMDERGISQNELAKHLNVSPTSVNNWCNGYKTPRMDKVDKICSFFHIQRSDLMNDRNSETSSTTPPNRIKVYGSVPAGVPIEAIEDIVDWEDIPPDWLSGGREYLGLRVKGKSMEPKYLEGDTIIVLRQDDCESGQDAVVYVNGYDATLKKVIKQQFGIVLQPLNPDFEPMFFDYGDEHNPIQILGVVVEIRRKV